MVYYSRLWYCFKFKYISFFLKNHQPLLGPKCNPWSGEPLQNIEVYLSLEFERIKFS